MNDVVRPDDIIPRIITETEGRKRGTEDQKAKTSEVLSASFDGEVRADEPKNAGSFGSWKGQAKRLSPELWKAYNPVNSL